MVSKCYYEAPYLREAYIELAYMYYEDKDYDTAYKYLKEAYENKHRADLSLYTLSKELSI